MGIGVNIGTGIGDSPRLPVRTPYTFVAGTRHVEQGSQSVDLPSKQAPDHTTLVLAHAAAHAIRR